ncbi:unnamed protein product [Symbiodinium natans]|uniref:Uncharacterized protein n=1 Tax=Symbiodinium natans TaxID=878477 RepID=A0A812JHT4_9DINO|nr:unnamed protein product [Symbiodinium natans]
MVRSGVCCIGDAALQSGRGQSAYTALMAAPPARPWSKAELTDFLAASRPSSLDLEARRGGFASFLHDREVAKQAGHDSNSALDLAYNAEIQTMRADEKADDTEVQVEAAEGWEEYELSLLALLSLAMVGTAGWLYNQYQRWLALKKAMAEYQN